MGAFAVSVGDPGTANTFSAIAVGRKPYDEPFRFRNRSQGFAISALETVVTATLGIAFAVDSVRAGRWPTYTPPGGGTPTPVTLTEKSKTLEMERTKDSISMTRTYLITGSEDAYDVRDVGPQVGDPDSSNPLLTVQKRSDKVVARQSAGGLGMIEVVVELGASGSQLVDVPDPQFSMEFGSGTDHVDLALAQSTYESSGSGATTSDLNINTTDEGVEGVDIESPVLNISEEHYFAERNFSVALRRMIRDRLKHVNSQPFREWDIGEVLFDSCSARKAARGWNVTFNFKVSRNRMVDDSNGINVTLYPDIASSPVVATVSKRGWEYFWVRTHKLRTTTINSDGTTSELTKQYAKSAHVAAVYPSFDFAALGIQTTPLV